MTKKGFTLMELLVSIFITGMVMLSLVAMWKTSSSQTAQAQRQSIIKNENTIFLRKIYTDFVSASEIICPWGYSKDGVTCQNGYYIAVKEAVVVKQGDSTKLVRITNPVCGTGKDSWATGETLGEIAARCIKPSYVVYVFDNNSHFVYRCINNSNFLTDSSEISLGDLKNAAQTFCGQDSGNREVIMPYVANFSLSIPSKIVSNHTVMFPELLVEYTINRDFGEGIPPFNYKFKRYLTKKRGA